jgi:hypothetical protein
MTACSSTLVPAAAAPAEENNQNATPLTRWNTRTTVLYQLAAAAAAAEASRHKKPSDAAPLTHSTADAVYGAIRVSKSAA